MSIFGNDVFGQAHAMGDVPADARPIAQIEQERSRFPRLPSLSAMRSGGITHFTTQTSGVQQVFTYYDAEGAMRGRQALPLPQSELPEQGATEPAYNKTAEPFTPVAPRQGDGILPSDTGEPAGAQRWLPFALVGGALVVGGTLVWVATRRPAVTPNRRRRRSSRRRR